MQDRRGRHQSLMDRDRLKKCILALGFFAFCLCAAADLIHELPQVITLVNDSFKKSDRQIREAILGDVWRAARNISRIIPDNANVLMRTDDSCFMLYCQYELFPRKIFSYDGSICIPPGAEDSSIDWDWISKKDISWMLVLRTVQGRKNITIWKFIDGNVIKQAHFNI